MKMKLTAIRNEPLRQYRDIIPNVGKSSFAQLPPFVKARLEIEKKAVICPVGKSHSTIKWNNYHKKVLSIMMMESDSPVSASLRTFSVGIVGALGISNTIPELTKICLSENEDLRTRISATLSLFKHAEKGKTKNISQVLESRSPQIRFTALKLALSSKNKTLSDLGKKYLLKEKNKEIIKIINNKYESVSMKHSTKKSKILNSA